MANPPTDTTKEVKNQVTRAPWNIPGAMGYLKESFESEKVSGFPKEGTIYFNAVKDLFIEDILGLEKTPVPTTFQKAFEGEGQNKLDPMLQEQREKREQVEYEIAHYRSIVQNEQDLLEKQGKDAVEEAMRILGAHPTTILERSITRTSKDLVKGEVRVSKAGSSNLKTARDIAQVRTSDVMFESQQQGWVKEEVEEAESEKSLAETQPVVNMNAIMEGGTGGAKANISQTGGGAG